MEVVLRKCKQADFEYLSKVLDSYFSFTNDSKRKELLSHSSNEEAKAELVKELAKAFEKIGVGNADNKLIMEHLKKNGKAAVLPVLVEVLGPKVALGIIETIIVSLIAQIIGREAAKQLVKELSKRNPWLNALGPIMWALSGAWLAFDLQGPAYRKTVPICLYLGIVGLRDGTSDQTVAQTA